MHSSIALFNQIFLSDTRAIATAAVEHDRTKSAPSLTICHASSARSEA
ncbi:Uncharacterised protein [Vibrio cholerae]|nr:Uncharacterised protein [Vibrio cholerae]